MAIAWLLRYLGTHTLGVFVVYRIALGVLVLALAATRRDQLMPQFGGDRAVKIL